MIDLEAIKQKLDRPLTQETKTVAWDLLDILEVIREAAYDSQDATEFNMWIIDYLPLPK